MRVIMLTDVYHETHIIKYICLYACFNGLFSVYKKKKKKKKKKKLKNTNYKIWIASRRSVGQQPTIKSASSIPSEEVGWCGGGGGAVSWIHSLAVCSKLLYFQTSKCTHL